MAIEYVCSGIYNILITLVRLIMCSTHFGRLDKPIQQNNITNLYDKFCCIILYNANLKLNIIDRMSDFIKVAAVTLKGCKDYDQIVGDRKITTVTDTAADETKKSDTTDRVCTCLPSHLRGNEYVTLGNIRPGLEESKQTSLKEWTSTSHVRRFIAK